VTAPAARAVSVPARVPGRDVALVGDVHQHPGEELERVDGLGARRRALRLVGAVGDRFHGPVVGEPVQRDGLSLSPPPARRDRARRRAYHHRRHPHTHHATREIAVGIVACLQTHGSRANWHPHLHLLVTDGGFRTDGTFVAWPVHDTARLTEAFRRAVLRLFERPDLFDEEQAAGRLTWPHSGFPVHTAGWVSEDDRALATRLARYGARNPVALERLTYDRTAKAPARRRPPTAARGVLPRPGDRLDRAPRDDPPRPTGLAKSHPDAPITRGDVRCARQTHRGVRSVPAATGRPRETPSGHPPRRGGGQAAAPPPASRGRRSRRISAEYSTDPD